MIQQTGISPPLPFTLHQNKGLSPVTKTELRSNMACPPGKEAVIDTLRKRKLLCKHDWMTVDVGDVHC